MDQATNVVPSFKKGTGAVSVVIFSDDFTGLIGCFDNEKSRRDQFRFALPGGRKIPGHDYGSLETAIREAREEMGHEFGSKDLVELPWRREFPDGTTHDWFVALLPKTVRLRDSGTEDEVVRDGKRTTMRVLGPPKWMPLEKALTLPCRGPSRETFLHYSHVQGVCEAMYFLFAKGLAERHPPFKAAWERHRDRMTELRRSFNK